MLKMDLNKKIKIHSSSNISITKVTTQLTLVILWAPLKLDGELKG